MRTLALAVVALSLLVSLFASSPARASLPYVWSPGSQSSIGTSLGWDAYAATTGTLPLVFSSNPYYIYPGTGPGPLWWDGRMDGTEGNVTSAPEHIFLWHANNTDYPLEFAMTVENLSTTNTIGVGGYCFTPSPVSEAGGTSIALGEDMAYWGMIPGASWTPDVSSIGPGSIKTVWHETVASNCYMGAIFQFGVNVASGSGNLDYVIRIVECDPGNPYYDPTSWNTAGNPYKGTPIGATTGAGAPPRGTWPHDTVTMANTNDPYGGSGTYNLELNDDWPSPPYNPLFGAANSWTGNAVLGTASASDNRYFWGVTQDPVACVQHVSGCNSISAHLYIVPGGGPYAGCLAVNGGGQAGLCGIQATGAEEAIGTDQPFPSSECFYPMQGSGGGVPINMMTAPGVEFHVYIVFAP